MHYPLGDEASMVSYPSGVNRLPADSITANLYKDGLTDSGRATQYED